jgi:hypothetical protein
VNLKDFFPPEEVENAKRYVKIFHDRILLSGELSNPEALLLSAYMVANNKKTSSPELEEVKSIFLQSGKTEIEFSKALYEVTRRWRQPALRKKNDKLEFTYSGTEAVRKILLKKRSKCKNPDYS